MMHPAQTGPSCICKLMHAPNRQASYSSTSIHQTRLSWVLPAGGSLHNLTSQAPTGQRRTSGRSGRCPDMLRKMHQDVSLTLIPPKVANHQVRHCQRCSSLSRPLPSNAWLIHVRLKLLQPFSAEPTRLWLDGVPGVFVYECIDVHTLRSIDHRQNHDGSTVRQLTQLEHMDTGQVQLMLHPDH